MDIEVASHSWYRLLGHRHINVASSYHTSLLTVSTLSSVATLRDITRQEKKEKKNITSCIPFYVITVLYCDQEREKRTWPGYLAADAVQYTVDRSGR